ncbi:CCR4-NOT transcription complex subunit 1 [Glycine soja]
MTLVLRNSSPTTMANFSSNQIRFLLSSLNEVNFDSVFRQLSQFTEFGTAGCILLLQTCLDHYDYVRRDMEDTQHEPILGAVIKHLLGKLNFSTVFSESMRNIEINESFLESFCNRLQLSLLEKIVIGLALSDSENPDARLCGKIFSIARIEELCANPSSLSYHEQIHNIIMFLKQSEGLSKHVDSFMQILSLVQFKDTPPFFLTRLLPDEMNEADFLRNMELLHDSGENDFDAILADIQKEINIGDIVKELGYGCTVDVSGCKEILSLFLPLTDNALSKLLGAIAYSNTGLEDNQNTYLTFRAAHGYNVSELPLLNSWNIDVLIDTVKQLAPQTNWIHVIENLDHEGFFLPCEEAFFFLMSVYKHACKEPFPLHAICGSVWKNTEGQLSFLKYAVSALPEMFTFARSGRQLAYVDAVNYHKHQNEHANNAWLCLDLLDVLCLLAEKGHTSIVRSILDYPLKHCPEVLLLGMAHINTAYNLLQREVSLIVFPMIVKSPAGSGIILQLWHVNPNLVLRGLMDSQNNDADSIIRIVDICQELKILSSVVEIIPSYYSIRLAAFASRKEFLDLEKWLSRNLTTYKDVFFEECLGFLKDAHFGGSQNLSGKSFHQSGAVLSLCVETTATFLKVLKSHTDLVTSRQHSEELERLHISIIDCSQLHSAVSTSSMPSSRGFVCPSRGATSIRFGSALNIETLAAAAEKRETPIEAPGSEVQDKISLMINNTFAANIDSKAKEFTEILKEQYYPWFAQYMVMKRASIEPNFHDLYLKFLDKVNSKALNKEIIQATYENCKVLLGSELIKSSSEERSLLKNLGSWLGKLTIGRNQVLKAREIDPKSLIIEAYEKGLMIAVIPFISKILKSCQSSIAYEPSNPWTKGILRLLVEIYSMPNLKMNLMFDIEVLLKHLGVDMMDVTPTSLLLKDRKREMEGNPDFSNKDVGASSKMIIDLKCGPVPPVNEAELPLVVTNPSNTGAHPHVVSQYAGALHISSGALMEDEKFTPLGLSDQLSSAQVLLQATPASAPISISRIPDIGTRAIINEKLGGFGLQMYFNSVVPIAMDRAIKEIASSSFVQRTVIMATKTTMELVLKDYAMESDQTRILKAAHLMVTSLAGSWAHVTCKEPLWVSIYSQLRNSLQNLNITNEILEQAMQLVTNDNIDLGFAVIEQVAADKAKNTIDTEITQQLFLRRKHREGFSSTFFYANKEEFKGVDSVEPDPSGFCKQVAVLFKEWYRICEFPGANDTASAHFILQLHQNGLLKGDDVTDHFFRQLMELAIAHCLSTEVINLGSLQSQPPTMSFLAIDIYAKLVFSILKGSNELVLLSKIMAVTVRFIIKDAEEKNALFNPRPVFRLFINWLLDLGLLEPVTDGANLQILTVFANAFHALQPLKVPAFSFAWLELISHRSFMPKMLTGNGQKGWPYIQRLLVDLFQFMEPFLRHAELGEPVRVLYKGTLRVLLVLLHDFPEFLCDYHFTFCDVIPSSCIQMRNIILSACPRSMRLPDPSTPKLKIDLLQEINQSPSILSEVDAALKAKQIKTHTRQPSWSFLSELKYKLLLSPNEAASAGTRYNRPLINSLVLYVGMQAIHQLQERTPHTQTSANAVPVVALFSVDTALDIFKTLIVDLDSEGRYLFLNAIANQLRYPNTNTHYFSLLLLHLFEDSNLEVIQEQITRVLLERLFVERPHPWGILITFLELYRNPRYNFRNRSFITPEIEKLFESVVSRAGPKPVDES